MILEKKLNGIELKFIQNPASNGEVVVLLNGLFADFHSWDPVLPWLEESFSVLMLNMPGQGESLIPERPVDLDWQREILLSALNEFKLNQVHLVGLSNGGRVALSFAEHFPNKVKSLVAADCYAEATTLLKLKLESWLKANDLVGPHHRFDVATPWIWGESLLEKMPEVVDKYREKASLHHQNSVRNLILGAMEGLVDLTNIKAPTLLLVGEEDVLTPVYLHRKMSQEIGKCEFRVIAGGHASLLEGPESFQSVILPWLKSQKIWDLEDSRETI